jgi:DNA-binding NarL/FixJ family response regulator
VAQAQPPYRFLTEREHRLLGLLAEGFTNAQIGQRVHRSEKTVHNQLTRIYRKLGAANRAEAVALYLIRHRLPQR